MLVNEFLYFSSPVFKTNDPSFVETLLGVAKESLCDTCTEVDDSVYPVVMSANFNNNPAVQDFVGLVSKIAWDILDSQGYEMSSITTHVGEMWMQEHHKYSSMEQHVHRGYQIVGFYFLETPIGGSRAVFHDPRPAKVITDLPQKDINKATHGSEMVNFEVQPGDLILTNAWLPHSFTRNASNEPVRFVHFNIFVQQRQCEIV